MQTTLFEYKPIRALTWKEPFGTLMLYDKIETRSWGTQYRGDVLICCGKTPYTDDQLLRICGKAQIERVHEFVDINDLVHIGKAIAVGTLVDSRLMKRADEDACFVEYWPGLYCHIYENIRPIIPMPYRGQQGWKVLPESIWDEIQLHPEFITT